MGLSDVRAALRELEQASGAFSRERDAAVMAGDPVRLAGVNRRTVAFERAFVDPQGLAGRPWYRHLIHAPDRTYAPVVLPGLAESQSAPDPRRAAEEAARLAQALRRAAAVLK